MPIYDDEISSALVAGFFQEVGRDFKLVMRSARHSPWWALSAILSMGVAIGATTSIFSVVYAILIRPLPYPDPDRLVLADLTDGAGRTAGLPYAVFEAAQQEGMFDGLATYHPTLVARTGAGEPQEVFGYAVSDQLFHVLGVNPARGRLPDPAAWSKSREAVISYEFWRQQLKGSPEVIGSALVLDEQQYTIIGVMPKGFHFPPYEPADVKRRAEIWVPLPSSSVGYNGNDRVSPVLARLRRGAEISQARAQLLALSGQGVGTAERGKISVRFLRFRESTGLVAVRPALEILMVAVCLVLLIGCVNIANLQLARATAQRREWAVRAALGASPSRLIAQPFVEGTTLAMIGGLLGFLLTIGVVKFLVGLVPANIPNRNEIAVDHVVAFWAFGCSIFSGILCSIVPAWYCAHLNTYVTVASDGYTIAGARTNFGRSALVALQTTLCIVLLIGSGLLLNSFVRLLSVHPGCRIDHILTANLQLARQRYDSAAKIRGFIRSAVSDLSRDSKVKQAAMVSGLPLQTTGYSQVFPVIRQGQSIAQATGNTQMADFYTVSAGYFEAMDIPLIRGRTFSDSDREGSVPVTVISRSFANRYFPGQDPIGQSLHGGPPPFPWATVVGVVEDVRSRLDIPVAPTFYLLFDQVPERYTVMFGRYVTFVMYTAMDPKALIDRVNAEIRALNPDQPISEITSMEDIMADAVAPRRFYLLALSLFAIFAFVLTCLGIVGIVTYTVEKRAREIGVRLALGATRGHVLRLVMGRTMGFTLVGTVIGTLAALAGTRVLQAQLYGIKPNDPLTFVIVPVGFLIIAGLASYLSARRATALDPARVLRLN